MVLIRPRKVCMPAAYCRSFLLKRLENAGLKPIVLVGGATGLIGDPSGKSQERNLLDLKTVQKNVRGLKKQLARFFDFGCFCRKGKVLFVNNYDWIKNISLVDILRDTGKHFTINEMISKESVQKEWLQVFLSRNLLI